MTEEIRSSGGSSPRLGVVVPMANEESTVEEFASRVLAQLLPTDRVFCVLDNACRDRTRQLVERISEQDNRLTLVWAPENRSVVDAYFRGYREAVAAGCTWILEMDAGLSHSPEQIPRFIAAMESGADYAGGSRFMPGGSHSGSWYRYAVSRGGTFLTNLLLGTRMHDMTSGFECFTLDALRFVLDTGVSSRAHFFQTEIRSMMHRWKWVEVPIDYAAPSSAVGRAQLLESIRILFALRRRRKTDRGESR